MTKVGLNGIQQSWLNLASGCNNRCIFCYYGHNLDIQSKFLEFESAKKILSLLKDIGVKDCALIGGEPTLYPNLIDLIEFGAKIGLSLSIVTNGRLLKDINYCKQIILAGIDKISISLEGFNKELHDYITQSEHSFKDTIQAINNFNKLDFNIDVITTLCNTNMNYWRNITELLSDLDFNQFVFNICTPSISPESENIEVPDLNELSDIIADMLNNDWGSKSLSIVTPFPLCLLENKVNNKVKLGLCQMFHGNGLTIDVDGSVLPCTHFSGGSLFNIFDNQQNIIDLNTFEILWSENIKQFQEKLWHYPAQKCVNCDQWKDCYGGCPLYWVKYNPESIIDKTSNYNKVYTK